MILKYGANVMIKMGLGWGGGGGGGGGGGSIHKYTENAAVHASWSFLAASGRNLPGTT